MNKFLNKTHLKIISCLLMIIDHVGHVFFPQYKVFRVIGRVAFPLFAYFVAEGMYYTKSRRKYQLTMLYVALVSQIPYMLVFGFRLNIIFTFLIAIQLISIYDNINKKQDVISYIFLANALLITIILSLLGIIEYGFWGVMLVFLIYILKNNTLYVLIAMALCLLMIYLGNTLYFGASLLSLIIILLYSGKKGKYDFKYFFYIFYPAHIIILYCLSLL